MIRSWPDERRDARVRCIYFVVVKARFIAKFVASRIRSLSFLLQISRVSLALTDIAVAFVGDRGILEGGRPLLRIFIAKGRVPHLYFICI